MSNRYLTKIAEEVGLEKEAWLMEGLGRAAKATKNIFANEGGESAFSRHISSKYKTGTGDFVPLKFNGDKAAGPLDTKRYASEAIQSANNRINATLNPNIHEGAAAAKKAKVNSLGNQVDHHGENLADQAGLGKEYRSVTAGMRGEEFNPAKHDQAFHTFGTAIGKNPKLAAMGAVGVGTLPFAPKLLGMAKNYLNPGITGQFTRFAAKHPIGTAAGLGATGLVAGNMMSGGNRDNRNN